MMELAMLVDLGHLKMLEMFMAAIAVVWSSYIPKDPWDWYIYLHLADFYGKSRWRYHIWILWVHGCGLFISPVLFCIPCMCCEPLEPLTEQRQKTLYDNVLEPSHTKFSQLKLLITYTYIPHSWSTSQRLRLQCNMQRNTAQHETHALLEIGFLISEDSKTWVSVDVQQDRQKAWYLDRLGIKGRVI